jgi:hypothetical protein
MIKTKNTQAEKQAGTTGKKIKYLLDSEYFFVEEFAQKNYEKEGFNSIWSENTYWWEIYALLFWDIIFAKIKGSCIYSDGDSTYEIDTDNERFETVYKFNCEVNGMPHDFFKEEFYEKRKPLFNNRLKELEHIDIKQALIDSHKTNFKKRCRPIENWDKFSIEQLCIAVDVMEKDKLLKIIERLFKNFSYNRSGLPDLFVYSKDKYFFAEVKSEKDKISVKQTEWHSFLSDELGIDVEIFSVNKNNKIEEKETKGRIKISFGKSTSKKRDEAISFIEKQDTFEKTEEKNDVIYSAFFDIEDIENLYTMLDYTSGWKSQKIELDGKPIHSTKLRNSLWCYKEKIQSGKSLDYCRTNEWDGSINKFGCKNFYFNELEQNSWREYGYIDTQKGEWIFDKEKIKKEIDRQFEQLNICPIFKPEKILKLFENIPDRVNPKTDTSWSFVDNNFNTWTWKNGNWKTQYDWDEEKFPGYSMMVGVEKNENKPSKPTKTINIEIQPPESKEKKKGFWQSLSDLF